MNILSNLTFTSMKKTRAMATGLVMLVVAFSSFAQRELKIDLTKKAKDKGLEVYNRELTYIDEKSYSGIRLSKAEGEGVAWIKGVEFSNGVIEFDVRGENVMQHSFVGLAFHGVNDSTFDAVYFRPFQFETDDAARKTRMTQYISLPDFTWRKLREKNPGVYESAIEKPPLPDAWFHVRMVIQDSKVTTYVNNLKEPSLTVTKVTPVKSGMVGLYVADTSGGDFANLKITKTN
jgi:hypothetical protein